MTTVTIGSESWTPNAVDGYDSSRTTASVVHQVLGRSDPDITSRPAALRTGTLRMIFADGTYTGGDLIVDGGYVVEADPLSVVADADSKACEDAHATGAVCSLASSEYATIEMSYIASGVIRRSLSANRAYWILEVDYQEVLT